MEGKGGWGDGENGTSNETKRESEEEEPLEAVVNGCIGGLQRSGFG